MRHISNSWAEPGTSCLTCRVWSWGWICLASMWGCISRIHGSSRSVHVGFFLELTNVFLVSDSFIPEPVGNLSRQTKEYSLIVTTYYHTEALRKTMAVFSLHGLNGMQNTAESLCQRYGLHRLVLWICISARMEWLPITVSLCHHDCSYHQNSRKHQSVNIR